MAGGQVLVHERVVGDDFAAQTATDILVIQEIEFHRPQVLLRLLLLAWEKDKSKPSRQSSVQLSPTSAPLARQRQSVVAFQETPTVLCQRELSRPSLTCVSGGRRRRRRVQHFFWNHQRPVLRLHQLALVDHLRVVYFFFCWEMTQQTICL